MLILGIKPGHDGAVAAIIDGKVIFSIENEKDSRLRNSPLASENLLRCLERVDRAPDVVAVSGWLRSQPGYYGTSEVRVEERSLLGRKTRWFSSSHERSHLLGAYGMSPFPQGQPCYALVWEGTLGRFYRIDENIRIEPYPTVLAHVGRRYAHIFYLASNEPKHSHAMAGKLMALAATPEIGPLSGDESRLIDTLLANRLPDVFIPNIERLLPRREDLPGIPWVGRGVERADFRSFAHHFSERLFELFRTFAAQHCPGKLPLLISGGCGLNCDWNTKWKDCGLFSDVFIPPCTNDSGSALGTCVDAQAHLTGQAKVAWDAYGGEEFQDDCATPPNWSEAPLSEPAVAAIIGQGGVVAWVNGRYEIGPRALGNRSLLAAPFEGKMKDELNRIKGREGYRPIAPVCLEEDVARHFAWSGASPYMLHFQRVTDDRLRAVTHDDGSARVQTVTAGSNPALHRLLTAFKRLTGTAVLCNTSLNWRGCGFINSKSDVFKYADMHGLAAVVIDGRQFTRSAG